MITRKQFVSTAFSFVLAGSLAACGGSTDSDATSEEASDQASAAQTLIVAATPSPHAEVLENFAAPLLAEKGITLEVREYTDYVQPNVATSEGEVDANYFQHINYLNDYNAENGTDLTAVAKIHYEPFGIYAGKSDDLANIADDVKIAVPNDPTNEARALLLLQQAGLIELKDPEDLGATPNDIVSNPHNITFLEIEAAATPRALEDVDFAAINGNYALEADLHASDALVLEEASGVAFEQYANVIVTTPALANDDRIAALVEVLQSDDFASYLAENYGQDVLPAA